MIGKWIISHFPEHKVYVEPYGGGASVLLRKPRSYAEVYNELDGEIVNVFRMLRDFGPELQQKLKETPFSRTEFFEAYDKVAWQGNVELARRTIIKSFMGFGSDSIQHTSGFRANSNRSGTTPAHDWANYGEVVDILTDRLKGVVIENKDALEVIAQHDSPDTLFYIDPPYVHSTRAARSKKKYAHEMTDQEHCELARVLKSVKGKVVLSGYDCELYNDLYKGWCRTERKTFADGARMRTEVLWANFNIKNQQKLYE